MREPVLPNGGLGLGIEDVQLVAFGGNFDLLTTLGVHVTDVGRSLVSSR